MSEIQQPLNLKGRHLLKEDDFTKKEFSDLIDFAITLKIINKRDSTSLFRS